MVKHAGALASAVLAAGLAASGATSQVAAQAPTFTTRVENVRVDALVTENGRPILGLSANDFEVLDNGVRQQIEHVSFDTVPVNLVLVLDVSESVSGPLLEQLRSAGRAAVSGLRLGDQVALVAFNHRVSLPVPLTNEFSRLTSGLDSTVAAGGTALADAAYAALWVAQPDPGRAVLVMFSDGVDTSSWLSGDRVLQAAKRTDAVIYGVRTAAARGNAFLSDLAEGSGGRVFDVASTDVVRAAFGSILDEFRQRYLVSYTPSGVKRTGYHSLQVRVKGHDARVRARAGYLAGPD